MLLFAISLLGPTAQAEVVDRVVAVVGGQLVVASDIALEEVLVTIDASPSPFWDRMPVEERLIDAAVIRHLAGELPLYQPHSEEVRARLEGARAHFAGRAAWMDFLASWGLDEGGLRQLLRRRMVVERYLARSIPVDTGDRDAWQESCDVLLSSVRPRTEIRRIPARGQ